MKVLPTLRAGDRLHDSASKPYWGFVVSVDRLHVQIQWGITTPFFEPEIYVYDLNNEYDEEDTEFWTVYQNPFDLVEID